MIVLVDSFGWIEYFADGPLANRYAPFIEKASKNTHFTPTVVVYEVYKRLRMERGEELALRAIAHIIAYTTLIGLDERLALSAAELSIEKRLAMADAIVAATARQMGAKLVTSDPDLRGLPEVVFVK